MGDEDRDCQSAEESIDRLSQAAERLDKNDLGRTLEAMILGEADDPDQAIASVIEAVTALRGSHPPPLSDPESAKRTQR